MSLNIKVCIRDSSKYGNIVEFKTVTVYDSPEPGISVPIYDEILAVVVWDNTEISTVQLDQIMVCS